MDKIGKYENRFQKIALSCDAFTAGYLVICLFMFAPYAAVVGGRIVMLAAPVGMLAVFAVMPLVYTLLHRRDPLLFGRYHLAMPLAALLAALFFVMTFGATADLPYVPRVCLMFFSMTIFTCMLSVYRYCSFSVCARLSSDASIGVSVQYELFCILGAAAAMGAYAGFAHFDSETAFLNTAYVVGGASVFLSVFQYLTTFYGIPRLGGKRSITVKGAFGKLLGGLRKRAYFSSLLSESGFALLAALTAYSAFFLFERGFIGVVAVTVVSYAAGGFIASRKLRLDRAAAIAVQIVCAMLGAALPAIVFTGLIDSINAAFGLFCAGAVVTGIGGAVTMRQTKIRFLTIKSVVTSGTVFILLELTMTAAIAVGLFFTGGVVTLSFWFGLRAALFGFAAAFLLEASGAALSHKRARRNVPTAFGVSFGDGDGEDETDGENAASGETSSETSGEASGETSGEASGEAEEAAT